MATLLHQAQEQQDEPLAALAAEEQAELSAQMQASQGCRERGHMAGPHALRV